MPFNPKFEHSPQSQGQHQYDLERFANRSISATFLVRKYQCSWWGENIPQTFMHKVKQRCQEISLSTFLYHQLNISHFHTMYNVVFLSVPYNIVFAVFPSTCRFKRQYRRGRKRYRQPSNAIHSFIDSSEALTHNRGRPIRQKLVLSSGQITAIVQSSGTSTNFQLFRPSQQSSAESNKFSLRSKMLPRSLFALSALNAVAKQFPGQILFAPQRLKIINI